MVKSLLTLTAAIGLAATPAFAAVTTLYSDNFDGLSSAALNGTTPDITIEANTWTASTDFKADGSLTGTGADSAILAFTPEAGKVYTLSVTLSQPTGTAANQWASVGFSNGITTAQTHNSGTGDTGGAPWILWRNGGAHGDTNDVEAYVGRRANPSGGAALGDFTGTRTLTVELNTLSSAWSARWLVDGTSLYSYTYKTLAVDPGSFQNFDGNPIISQISIARNASSAPVFDSLTFTAIPEPSTALAGVLLGAGLLRRRR
jgi:hypothetical protein